MQFQAYVVKQNSSPLLNVTLAGILIFLISIFLWAFEVKESIALFATVTGILLALIGGLLNRGKGLYEVGEDILIIDNEKIVAGSMVHPMSAITNLHFYYDSFYSQSPFGYFFEHAGAIEYGMHNTVSFNYHNNEVNILFYLAEISHADSFFSLLTYLKDQGVSYSFQRRADKR